MEKVHVLIAFGDIRGSRLYSQRVTDEKKQSIPFWTKFDRIIDTFEVTHEYFLKHLGDGFLCVAKIVGKNGAQTIRFLNECWTLKKKMDRLIANSKPAPDGFRIHCSAGPVIQKIQTNGEVVFHGFHIDLLGTTIKYETFKEVPFLVHESAKNQMSPVEIERAKFKMELMPAKKAQRGEEHVFKDEIERCYSFRK